MCERKKINAQKLFSKSLVFSLYQNTSGDAVKKKILCEYETLLRENDLPDTMLVNHQASSIYPAIAMHKVLMQNNCSKARSVQIIRDSVLPTALLMAKMFQIMEKRPSIFSLFRKIC